MKNVDVIFEDARHLSLFDKEYGKTRTASSRYRWILFHLVFRVGKFIHFDTSFFEPEIRGLIILFKRGNQMENFLIYAWFFMALVLIALIATAIKVVQEYERGVIFRLGRLIGAKGPGLFFIIPIVDRMVKVDLRVVTLDVPSQEAITRDNVTVKVNAVVFFRVIDPSAAVVQVEDFKRATWNIAQTTLRNVLGQSELDDLLSNREEINQRLQHIIDDSTEPWGVKVSIVEVKDVELPQSMQRAMAKQAEAEREKRAKIVHAEGEYAAAETLAEAAQLMSANPVSIQLRYLQTLTEISVEKNSTIIFPVPINLLEKLSELSNEVLG
jgi:regulator of protease activity HflC (stomatin/prohibitin superfamily)